MQNITELTLAQLPMEDPAFAENPWPRLESARKQHPWLSTCIHGYVVHQYDAMRDLLWLDNNLTGAYDGVVDAMQAHGTRWGEFQLHSLLASSGDTHKRIRAVLAPAFTPQQANKHRPLMRTVIAELLDEWAPKGEFDFEEFASYFPIKVMCSLIGAPGAAIDDLRWSMETFGLSISMNPDFLPQLEKATQKLEAFVEDLVAERRKNRKRNGDDDLLEMLIRAQEQGGISEDELYNLLIFLFVAGYDTSKNALTLLMDVLIGRPEIYQRCAEDLDYCKKVVEENFRYLTTATVPRNVTKDITYRDVLIPKGTMLWFPVSIAGQDATAIDHPEIFDPDRDHTKKHMAFSLGVHICMGQFIARAQIEEALHQIAQRMRNPRRAGASGWRPFFGVWGLKGLPITFDPAPARELEAAV